MDLLAHTKLARTLAPRGARSPLRRVWQPSRLRPLRRLSVGTRCDVMRCESMHHSSGQEAGGRTHVSPRGRRARAELTGLSGWGWDWGRVACGWFFAFPESRLCLLRAFSASASSRAGLAPAPLYPIRAGPTNALHLHRRSCASRFEKLYSHIVIWLSRIRV